MGQVCPYGDSCAQTAFFIFAHKPYLRELKDFELTLSQLVDFIQRVICGLFFVSAIQVWLLNLFLEGGKHYEGTQSVVPDSLL